MRSSNASLAVPALAALLLAACPDDTKKAPAADVVPDAVADVPADAGDVAPLDDVETSVDTEAPPDADALADPGPLDGDDAEDVADAPDAPPAEVVERVAECRQWLGKAQPYWALAEAEAALEVAPDDPDALFCAALAGVIDRAEFGLGLMTLLDMAATYSLVEEPSYGDALAEQMHDAFTYLHTGFATAKTRLDALVDADLAFDLDGAWLYFASRPVLVWRGRFDHGDVMLMRVVLSFVTGFLDIIRGQDFRTDSATLIALFRNNLTGGFDMGTLMDALAYLLAVDDRFLTLHPDDGPAAFQEGRDALADLGAGLREALAAVADTPSGGAPQVSTAEKLMDGTWVLHVQGRAVRDDETLEVDEQEIRLELAPEILAGLDAVSASVAEPGKVVPFSEGMQPMLGLVLSTMLELGLLGDLEIAGIALPMDTFTAADLSQLLGGFIGAVSGQDFGSFYANPVGLRFLFPVMTAGDSLGSNHFLVEWECPGDIGDTGLPSGWQGLLCGADAELVDAPHFVGTPWEIPADGYLSTMPYFAWEDPTLNGLMHADLSTVLEGQPEGFQPTEATTINIVVAELLGPILKLIGK